MSAPRIDTKVPVDGAEFRARAAHNRALAEKLTNSAQEVIPGTAAELAASIDEQFKAVAKIGNTLGIKPAQTN